jgi:hypothetical protein
VLYFFFPVFVLSFCLLFGVDWVIVIVFNQNSNCVVCTYCKISFASQQGLFVICHANKIGTNWAPHYSSLTCSEVYPGVGRNRWYRMPRSGPEEPGAQHLHHQSLTIGRSPLGGVRFRYCAHFYRQTDTSRVVHSHQGMPSVDQRPVSLSRIFDRYSTFDTGR